MMKPVHFLLWYMASNQWNFFLHLTISLGSLAHEKTLQCGDSQFEMYFSWRILSNHSVRELEEWRDEFFSLTVYFIALSQHKNANTKTIRLLISCFRGGRSAGVLLFFSFLSLTYHPIAFFVSIFPFPLPFVMLTFAKILFQNSAHSQHRLLWEDSFCYITTKSPIFVMSFEHKLGKL